MQATFLLGPAGSGKTQRCLAEVRGELLRSSEGPPLVLLAPKQATFQLERQLLDNALWPGSPVLHGYTRLQILSFERLARLVLAEFSPSPPPLLDEEGRVMVLRALLARKQAELEIFRATARLPGFAGQLSLVLRELQRHQHSPEKLFALADKIDSTPQLGRKLRDLALLLRAYLDWLEDHHLQDANSLLDLAAEVLNRRSPIANRRSPIRFGGLWLDGFAEMTPQELDFLAALAPFCQQATLAFCLDHEPKEDVSWLSTWSIVSQTFRNCHQRLAALPECKITVEVLPRERHRGRFAANPALAHLEEHWTNPKPFGGRPAVPAEQDRRDACPSLKEALFVALCPDAEAEAVLAAREILRHVREGGRYRDCAVLLRNLESYHHVLRRVLRRYEIPFFLDRREPVAYHPLAELTRYALRTAAFGWEHDDWFGALKTGLVRADPGEIDRLENEALARGWRGNAWQQPLRVADDCELEQRLEGLRQQIVPPFRQLAKQLAAEDGGSPCQPTGSQLAAAVREFWNRLSIEETLERWSNTDPSALGSTGSAFHSTVCQQMESWLGNLERAFPNESLPLRDWLVILEAGLSGLSVGVVPPALDQVLIGAIDRSRHPELQLAVVLGLNESVFPAAPNLSGLLTKTDREQLEAKAVALGPDKRAQLGHERYFGYIAFTRAKKRLVLTCAERDSDDTPLNRSRFLGELRRLFPGLEPEPVTADRDWRDAQHSSELVAALIKAQRSLATQESNEGPQAPEISRSASGSSQWEMLSALPVFDSMREQVRALATYSPADTISPALAELLYGPVLRTSVSALEQFAACPFRFFVHSGLRAEERKYFEADARERGSFQHEALRRYHDGLRQEGKEWRDLTPLEARERMGRIAEQLAVEFREGLFQASAENLFAARGLTNALQDFIETVTSWMPRYGLDPRVVEVSFGGEGDVLPAWEIDLGHGHQLAFRGKIDRVDLAVDPGLDAARCAVMDYKSGAKKVDPLLLEHGIQIQLPAYLAALRSLADPRPMFGVGRLIPAGVFYVNLRGNYPAGRNRGDVLSEAGEQRRLAYRHAGRFTLEALPFFDRSAPAGNSGQFNYALKKDGEPDRRRADLLPWDEFDALLNRVGSLLREMGQRIYAGEARVDPYRKGTETACQHCEYRAVCRIDPPTHVFRLLTKADRTTLPGP